MGLEGVTQISRDLGALEFKYCEIPNGVKGGDAIRRKIPAKYQLWIEKKSCWLPHIICPSDNVVLFWLKFFN